MLKVWLFREVFSLGDRVNILYVTLSLDIGGLEILLLEFLKALNRVKFNPSVCVLQEKGELITEIRRLGIPVYVISKKPGIDYTLPFKLLKLIKDKNIHIVHTHNSTPWLYAGLAVKMLKRVHLVHTKHSNLDARRKRLLKAESYLAKRTDYIIADAQDVFQFMMNKQAIPASKIKVIFNGIDIKKFASLKRAENKEGKKTIGIIGRLVPVKDHITLLSAFKIVSQKLNAVELFIIGDGQLKENLIKYCQENGLNEKVKFLGARRDIPELMQQIDSLVLTSLNEGLSITLLEAMAAGLPVIATNVGGNPEIVKDNETGFLVPPKNPKLLAEKIITLLSDQKLANGMAEKGRKRAKEYFSIEKMVRSYEQLYDALEVNLDNMARIAIIGEFPPPEGGMAVQAKLFFEKLKEEKVKVFALKRNYEFKRRINWIGKIKMIRAIISFFIFTAFLLKILFKVESLYILSNSYLNFYLYTLPPVWLGKLFCKKIIVNFHGGAAEKFLNKRVNFLARSALSTVDFITVPSGYLKDIFAKIGLSAIAIPNIVNLERFTFRKRERLEPNFIVTRHLEPEYNVGMVIRSFAIVVKKYPQARLKICGNGSEKGKLKSLTYQLGLGNSVEFLGSLGNEKIAELYNSSDILLNGSEIDNLPVSILEAFACGLPVVSTKAGGIPYLVEHEKTGLLVELNDSEVMAKDIERLLENAELAQTLSENARKSLEKYSWDNIKPKLLPLLKSRQILPLNVKIYQYTIFHIFDLFRGRRNLEKLQFLRKSQYWPKETIEEWQLKRLNELLTLAKEKSPFYRERLHNTKLPLRDLSALQDIPILTKKDIRQNKDSIKCQDTPEILFILGKTGGSTGEPIQYYYDKRGRDWNRGCVYRSQEWTGTYLGQRSIQMTGSRYDYTEFKKLKWKLIFWLLRYRNLPASFINDQLFEQYYKEILKYRPTNIWAYSSAIYHFSKFIVEKHKNSDFSFLKAIITSSETLFDFQKRKISEAFGENKIFDHYGSREFYIASECEARKGYHIHSEVMLVEVVDHGGKHKKPGELGRILITDLSNRVFPFIRYEIGDVGDLGFDENCPCGITLPKLASVEGRIADVLILPDRILTPPNFTNLLGQIDGIEQYQIIQKDKSVLNVKIIKNNAFRQEDECYIRQSFAQLAGANIKIELEYVSEISMPASGKRRFIISELSEVQL